jgi:hypothetical protein
MVGSMLEFIRVFHPLDSNPVTLLMFVLSESGVGVVGNHLVCITVEASWWCCAASLL